MEGGVVNGTPVDPLTFLMHTLQERFGNLGEEVRVQAVTELMSFSRKGNENIDALLVRFDSIRTRAAEQGGAIVSVQGVAWLLLRAVGISDQQLLHLLQPFGGLFPANEAELTQLKTSLRRMGHILEHAPGNIREGLRSQSSNASGSYLTHSEAYWTDQEAWPQSHIGSDRWSDTHAFPATATPGMPSEPVDAFATFEDDDIDTDSITSSGECSSIRDDGADPQRTAQNLFWAYRQAKHKWRKYMGKNTRAVRRYAKRFERRKGKGKGKPQSAYAVGKGKGKKGKNQTSAMLAEMSDSELQHALPAFRGHRTPGKGKGRKTNPRGPDGQTMRCYECGSIEHLAGSCPRRQGGQPSGQATTFFANPTRSAHDASAGPLAGILGADDMHAAPSRAHVVTFATHANELSQPNQVFRSYMVSESNEEDPLQANDPWGSTTTRSWSIPTSIPQSFGPAPASRPSSASARHENNPLQYFRFPFNNFGFGRSAVSEPAQAIHVGNSESASRTSTPQDFVASSPPGLAEARSPLMGDTPAGSSDPNAGNMQWASMAQMPPDLRELMPWPVLANTRATPEVPRFAMNPAFDFLQMSEQLPMPTPPSLRNPQQSTLEGPLRDQIEEFHYVQQQVAYQRQQVRNARPQTRPNVQVRSQLDPRHRPELGEFHQVQRTVARNSRRSRISERSINVEDVEYDGASDQCPLCQDLFLAKESVLRLVCKHLYHTECWSEWMCRGSALHCPVCRGNCHIIARYRIPEESASAPANIPSQLPSRAATPERADRQPDVYLLFTPPNRRTNAQESPDGTPFFSPEQHADTFPWWPSEEDSHAKAVYHSISIPNRAGIIIDPGAYTNLIGEHTARSFAKMAIEHGYTPRQWRMKPMFVQGVGEGQQKCEWTVSIPIACRLSVEGRVCCLNYFEAPVVGGSGARLPALLGLRSLSALSATLCMREGQESLFVPVAGNEASELSQQRRCPLDKAPSGHLIMTIDNWGELKHDAQAGVRPEPMVLHVDPSSSAAEESSIPAAI